MTTLAVYSRRQQDVDSVFMREFDPPPSKLKLAEMPRGSTLTDNSDDVITFRTTFETRSGLIPTHVGILIEVGDLGTIAYRF